MPSFLKTNVWSFSSKSLFWNSVNIQTGTPFFGGGNSGFGFFTFLLAGHADPRFYHPHFHPPTKTRPFCSKNQRFPLGILGGNGYPQVHQLGRKIPAISPTNWKYDSRGSCLHQVLPLVTGDLFRVLFVTLSGVKLLTLHFSDQNVTTGRSWHGNSCNESC